MNNNHPLIWSFKRSEEEQIGKIIIKSSEKTDDKDEKKKIFYCKICKNAITSDNDIIEINGHHIHTFKNPMGIVYQIGCFLYARGCINVGVPTTEFTWFPGYRWCYTLCSRCQTHLGWHYQSGEKNFYGLVLDNLTRS